MMSLSVDWIRQKLWFYKPRCLEEEGECSRIAIGKIYAHQHMSFEELEQEKILKQERPRQHGPGLSHRCSGKGFE